MGLYIEMQRLRGKEISAEEIRLLKHTFEQQLLYTLPTQPSSIFWPFNEEAAEKMRNSDDKRRYTFFLRISHWSNGQRVTAHDYSNGWKHVLSGKWTSNRPDLLFIIKNGKRLYNRQCSEQELGVCALDATTLRVDLEYADPHFLEKLAQPFFFPALGNSQEPNAFNGPYRVAHYNQHALELEINPYYWDAQKLFFQGIHIDLNLTQEKAWTDFKKGDLDWLGEPFTPLSNTFAQQLKNEGKLLKREVLRPFFLFLNTQHPLLRSREIRQALGLSIDRAYICKNILPNSLPLYHPVPMAKCHTIHENSQKALELFERGVQNLSLSKNYLPTLMFNYIQHAERELFARYLQHTWKEMFNLSLDIQSQPWNLLRGNLEKKDFHLSGCCVSALYSSPIDWLQGFEEEESFSNFSGWDHPEYRSVVSSIVHVKESEQTRLIEGAASIFAYESPAIPVCSCSIIYAKHAQLKGEVFDSSSCVDFRFSFLEE